MRKNKSRENQLYIENRQSQVVSHSSNVNTNKYERDDACGVASGEQLIGKQIGRSYKLKQNQCRIPWNFCFRKVIE